MDDNKPIPFNAAGQAPMETGPAKEPTKLHFCRVRGKEDAAFFDPQTDIRKLLPNIMADTLDLMEQACEDKESAKRVDNIRQCLYVFRLRLLEDPTPYAEQLKMFDTAIRRNGNELVDRFYAASGYMALAMVGLFMRRDSRADETLLHEMLFAAETGVLLTCLTPELRVSVKACLQASPVLEVRAGVNLATEKKTVTHNAIAVCPETGRLLQNLRGRARKYISTSGPSSWEELAAACDKEFSNPSRKLPADGAISVALAYPTYDAPNLEVCCDEEEAGEKE